MKKYVSFILAIVMIMCITPVSFANNSEELTAAIKLYELGLFQGTGTDQYGKPNFELNRAPTRHEAVTMLVRLLGKEAEAKSTAWEIPFSDVADWAKPYVGYAYVNGLTTGMSATTYGGDSLITASQYLTFVLRALGYKSGIDFQWNTAWELSDTIGLTNGEYNSTSEFTRGDVAAISANALNCMLADHDLSLFDSIYGTSNNQHIREGTTLLDRENFSIIYECGIINESFTVINLKVTNKMSHSSGHSEQFCKPDVFAININGVTYDAYTGLESCSEEIIAEGASATVTIVISAGYSDGLTAIHTLAADILVWTGIFSDGKYHLGCSGDGSCNGRFYYSVFPEISDNQRYIYGSKLFADENLEITYVGEYNGSISYAIRNKSEKTVCINLLFVNYAGVNSSALFEKNAEIVYARQNPQMILPQGVGFFIW